MNGVILDQLSAEHQVANKLCVLRDGDFQRILDRSDARQRMNRGAHAAGPLGERPGVARVAPLQDFLEAAHHRARAEGVGYAAVFNDSLYSKMSFDAGDRINYDARH